MSLLNFLLISLGIQLLLGSIAIIKRTDILTDISYGLTFLLLVAVSFFTNMYSDVKLVLFLLVVVWSIRIASYLFIRILKTKRDRRFDGIREDWKKFLSFWILQGVTVWIVLLPALTLFSTRHDLVFNWITVIGLVVSSVGLIIETVADIQKFRFKMDSKNGGKWTNVGLWKYSRHPNYLGEIMMWVGVFIFAMPFLSDLQMFTIISPLFISHLLINVTGIPTLEKRYEEKFGNDKEYSHYKRRTGRLLPRFF